MYISVSLGLHNVKIPDEVSDKHQTCPYLIKIFLSSEQTRFQFTSWISQQEQVFLISGQRKQLFDRLPMASSIDLDTWERETEI